AQLGAEQDEHAHDQHEHEHELPVLVAERGGDEGGHVGPGGLLPRQVHRVGHEDGGQQHAQHGADEEDAPHVDHDQPVPAPPHAAVAVVVGEGDAAGQDLAPAAAQAGDVAGAVAHAVATVSVVAHDVPVQPRGQGGEPGEAAELGGGDAGGRRGRGEEAPDAFPPQLPRHEEQVDDQQGDEDRPDHEPVGQFQGAADPPGRRGDQEDEHEQRDGPEPRLFGPGGRDLAVEERVHALPGGGGPAAGDEGEDDDEDRDRDPEFPARRDPPPADHRGLAGGGDVAGALDVVEGLQHGRDEDDPADADEIGRASSREIG